MDTLFHKLIITGKIVIYINDILIFTWTIEEHWNIVRQVLQILANNKLSVEYSWILVSKLSYVDEHSHRAL